MKCLEHAYGLSFLNIGLFLQEAAVPAAVPAAASAVVPAVAQVPAKMASAADLVTIMDLMEMQA